MKIQEIITEEDLDKKIQDYFKQRELKKQKAAKMKALTDRPGLGSTALKSIQRGKRWYDVAKDIATRPIPYT